MENNEKTRQDVTPEQLGKIVHQQDYETKLFVRMLIGLAASFAAAKELTTKKPEKSA